MLRNTDVEQGKKGKDSAAAKYASATPPDGFSVQEDKPYAEVSVQ
jgi:mannose-6-phosphate isomerase